MSEAPPPFSGVIPAYNRAERLRAALARIDVTAASEPAAVSSAGSSG